MVPWGTFGNFMQDDSGLEEYIKGLQDTIKKFDYKKQLYLQTHKRNASEEATYINNTNAINRIAERMKEKNNSKKLFLNGIKDMLSNKDWDYVLLTVFTKPDRNAADFDECKKEIEKIYNTNAFKQKYLSLFRKMNIDERDLEYSAKYEDDDAIHIYIKIINPKWVFYTMGLSNKNKVSDDELQSTIVHRKWQYLWMTLPVWFTFHCQMSQRFFDEDMEKIIAFDDKNNPTWLQVVDQISTPEVESMKIFVIWLSDTI
jgi:hypothetical protein